MVIQKASLNHGHRRIREHKAPPNGMGLVQLHRKNARMHVRILRVNPGLTRKVVHLVQHHKTIRFEPVYLHPTPHPILGQKAERQNRVREVSVRHPDFPETLIHGVLFRASYLGSTQLLSQKQPTRNSRMYQAQEAVNRVKAPDGENQPSVAVALFVSTERIMLLNSNLQVRGVLK
ncbi:unnamed protein product [Echinostoma caproni]|uniref:PID domain-containing protein n=1 Tax=Echinostoma caproni TaxID=27848 RepID=A0A182ZZH2_9TREM|nr:unnamed protein product [Echinostoma caproni]